MKNGSILFAKAVIYLIGLGALAVCVILLPELAREEATGKPNPELIYGFLATAYVLATPFFIALYQTHKLLHLIEKKKAFSEKSLQTLKNIKYCAVVFSILIAVVVITVISILRVMYPTEDGPPFMMMGVILTFTSSVIAVFVAVLQKLLSDAIALKSENDLII